MKKRLIIAWIKKKLKIKSPALHYMGYKYEYDMLKNKLTDRPISKFKLINAGNRTAHFTAYFKCCNCGYQEPRIIGNIYNYCPKCGAKMEGVAKIATTTEEVEE